jgi:hypothetical protein
VRRIPLGDFNQRRLKYRSVERKIIPMKKLLALVLFAAMGVAGLGCDKAATTKASSGGPATPNATPPKTGT